MLLSIIMKMPFKEVILHLLVGVFCLFVVVLCVFVVILHAFVLIVCVILVILGLCRCFLFNDLPLIVSQPGVLKNKCLF